MSTVKFRALGIRVSDGQVTVNERAGKHLGPLAGARAEITDGVRVHNMAAAVLTLMPVFALTKRTKGACAFVIFADGKVHERKLADQKALAAAKADAIRFSALAGATPVTPADGPGDRFTAADHDRARKAGQAAMARLAEGKTVMARKRSLWSQTRRDLYFAQRFMGDASAAARGPDPIAKRLVRRRVTRSAFRLFR